MADRLRSREKGATRKTETADTESAQSGSTTSEAAQPADAAQRTWTKAELEAIGGDSLVQMVRAHTGSDADTVDGETVARVLRNESLQQLGIGHVLESRVIGAKSPLELTDEEVQDRIAEFAAKGVVAAHLEKATDEITVKDFARFNELVLEAHAEVAYGKSLADLSPLERMQLASAVRNAQFDAARVAGTTGATRTGTDAATDAATSGSTPRDAVGGIASDVRVGSGAVSSAIAGAGASGAATGAATTSGTASSSAAASAASGTVADTATSARTGLADAATTASPDVADATTGAGTATTTPPSDTADTTTTPSEQPVAAETATSTNTSSSVSTTQPASPPPSSTPAENPATTDYGQGQSMPAYDDEGFVGSLAGPEDYNQSTNGIWYLVWGQPDTPIHFYNPTTGQTAVFVDGLWVNAATGDPVDTINEHYGSTGTGTSGNGSGSDASGATTAGESSDTGSASSESTGDDDDDDGDDDGEQAPAATTESTAGDDTSADDDQGSDPGGEEGTPHPDYVYVDPAKRAAFHETPVGRAEQRMTERGIEENAPGAGVIDPPDDTGDRGGSSGGPLRFIGGAIDPPDFADGRAASLSVLDEMALPGAGVIDPPDDAPVGESGASPLGGGLGPIVGGGLRSAVGRGDLFDDEDGDLGQGSDGDGGGAGFHGLGGVVGAELDDLFDTRPAFALDTDHLAANFDLHLDADDLGDALDG